LDSGKYKYITTYEDIFNRQDIPDENFCFNGAVASSYLSDQYSNPIKYFIDDDLTCSSSLSKNE